jgi:hypothetical protein
VQVHARRVDGRVGVEDLLQLLAVDARLLRDVL